MTNPTPSPSHAQIKFSTYKELKNLFVVARRIRKTVSLFENGSGPDWDKLRELRQWLPGLDALCNSVDAIQKGASNEDDNE
jgi:hypothetical protein